MSHELKPCPFCGSTRIEIGSLRAAGHTWWQVECANDECGGHSGDRGSEENAIAAWNTRATPPLDAKTADDMEGLAILGRLRGAARGLCTEDPADYIPRGISAKDAIAAATLIESYARQIAEARVVIEPFAVAAGSDLAMCLDNCYFRAASRWLEGRLEQPPSPEITEAFATIDDAGMRAYIDQLGTPETLEQAIAARNAWVESAAQFNRNEEYYRGLVDEIGQALGPDAFTADDGTLYNEVIRAKVPELVRERLRDAGGVLREAVGMKGEGR